MVTAICLTPLCKGLYGEEYRIMKVRSVGFFFNENLNTGYIIKQGYGRCVLVRKKKKSAAL